MGRGEGKLYHGTTRRALKEISKDGLRGGERTGVFLTDSKEAALSYARSKARDDDSAVLLEVEAPPAAFQPNGTVAPPYFLDDWHRDSGMPGEGWELDQDLPSDSVRVVVYHVAPTDVVEAIKSDEGLWAGESPEIGEEGVYVFSCRESAESFQHLHPELGDSQILKLSISAQDASALQEDPLEEDGWMYPHPFLSAIISE